MSVRVGLVSSLSWVSPTSWKLLGLPSSIPPQSSGTSFWLNCSSSPLQQPKGCTSCPVPHTLTAPLQTECDASSFTSSELPSAKTSLPSSVFTKGLLVLGYTTRTRYPSLQSFPKLNSFRKAECSCRKSSRSEPWNPIPCPPFAKDSADVFQVLPMGLEIALTKESMPT